MIREHPRFQKTAIIFVSAVHLTDLDRLAGYERGAVDYVPVPVVPEILRAKVGVFAELYRKTRQLERLNRELESRVARAHRGARGLDRAPARELRSSCARPTAARTSSWRCWRTSCATRWRRSATRSQLMRLQGAARRADARWRARRDRAPGRPAGAAGRRPAGRLAHHARQDQAAARAGRRSRAVIAQRGRDQPAADRRAPATS